MSYYMSLILGVIISMIAFELLYRPFFGKEDDFWECVKYYFTPNFFPLVEQDLWKALKLGIFFSAVIGCGIFGARVFTAIFK